MVERGSPVAEQLWATAASTATSVLASVEGRAALAAARRSGRLEASAYARAGDRWATLEGELLRVGVDEGLIDRAGVLAGEHALRGYDAVHLASALALGVGAITMVTWDERLGSAAHEEGLSVAGAFT